MTINVTVDEVILHGVDPGDPEAFRAALHRALAGLAAAYQGEFTAGRAAALDGAPVPLTGPGLADSVARSAFHSIVPARPASSAQEGTMR
ncbi:hypothetical protein [Catellatospora vulcania]|uniref:hypothetical protein n=1 Tax=Catellatospora vulcania TaxID=1460450 RepID=UPI0012D4BFD6|nr:hypothetical protein [Catellatospora vulcania]